MFILILVRGFVDQALQRKEEEEWLISITVSVKMISLGFCIARENFFISLRRFFAFNSCTEYYFAVVLIAMLS